MKPLLTTAHGVARMFNLHHETAKKYLEAFKVPSIVVGKRVYYRTVDVVDVMTKARDEK